MARVYWDSMLFIYWFDEHPEFASRIQSVYRQHLERGDEICSSYFTLGEMLAGYKMGPQEAVSRTEQTFEKLGLTLLPFELEAARLFGEIRRSQRISATDAFHLASAGAHGVELFLTGDKQLTKARVPGIHFIADVMTTLF